ncbi:MAG TPA: carboxypeptidase-like regulatory domain-containing protein [Terracidiphilus sp.]|jgi:hypothetical protein
MFSADSAPAAPDLQPADLNGTVTDVNGDLVPGATVALNGPAVANPQTQVANDSGFFQFGGLKPGGPYRLTITSKGFENWVSQPITLAAGQFFNVSDIKLKLEGGVSSVTVYSSTEEIATHQVELEEQQRIMGFIPNFYVVYDAKDAVPLTTKLKFKMAARVSIDPVSVVGAAFLAGMNQAGDTPNYRQGAIGYGQRFGQAYADGLTDIMFGGAILPSLLHQDPRYFYQGTGTTKSRVMHALSAPFICRGDNGKNEINFSSMGGDLISGAISNAYYPESNRGAGLVFEGFALSTGERMVSTVVQEFILKKLTPGAKDQY